MYNNRGISPPRVPILKGKGNGELRDIKDVISKNEERGGKIMKRTFFIVLAVLFLCLGANSAGALEILPDSYTFDRDTDTGTYAYHDWTGIQIIDGEYGIAPWSADLGNGNAYEWVGWRYDTPINIDFDFGAVTAIDSINVGSVQDHINDVVLPSIEILSSDDGMSWVSAAYIYVPESSDNNNIYMTYEFDTLGIQAQYVRVQLIHSYNGPWTFVDEVDFFTDSAPVPEPATMFLLGSGLLGLAGIRRKFVPKS